MTTDEVVGALAQAAREHAGDPQWFPFFLRLHEVSETGMMLDVARWHDDGSCRHLVQRDSLLHFCSNFNSQRGDDGIIRRIFQVLGVETGFFVEFGAWNGVCMSNCRGLAVRGWPGCYIEADAGRAAELRQNYGGRLDVLCVQEMVLPVAGTGGRTIDEIARAHFPGRHVDLMVIDVDGLSHRIFEEMQMRPTVVCVEGGFPWHPRFSTRVPEAIARENLEQPLAVMIEIGRKKGYTAICFNQNVYFVVDELADRFPAIQKDAETLWRDAWFNESQALRESIVRARTGAVIRAIEGVEFVELGFERMLLESRAG